MGSGRHLLIAVLMAGLAACFVDESAPAGSEGSTGPGTPDCPAGMQGCECYGNGTCNDGLECRAGGGCFPASCISGTESCPCFDDRSCNDGLECSGLQCLPPSSGTTDTTTGTSTTGPMPTTTDPSGPETTTGATSGGSLCDGVNGGGACGQCAAEFCCDEALACLASADPACSDLADCVASDTGTWIECVLLSGSPDASSEFHALMSCLADAPAQVCRACAPPTLVCLQLETAVYLECTECAAQMCCNPLEACWNDTACQDYSICLAMRNDNCISPTMNMNYEVLAMCATDCVWADDNSPCFPGPG